MDIPARSPDAPNRVLPAQSHLRRRCVNIPPLADPCRLRQQRGTEISGSPGRCQAGGGRLSSAGDEGGSMSPTGDSMFGWSAMPIFRPAWSWPTSRQPSASHHQDAGLLPAGRLPRTPCQASVRSPSHTLFATSFDDKQRQLSADVRR